MHFTNSTLKFKVPRTLAVPDVNDQLLKGDRKLHFELSSEIGGGVATSHSIDQFWTKVFSGLCSEGTFAKER